MTEHVFRTVPNEQDERIAITVLVTGEDGERVEVTVTATGWADPVDALKAFHLAGRPETLMDLAESIDAALMAESLEHDD